MADAMQGRLVADLAGWIEENTEPFAPGHRASLGAWMSAMVQDTSRRILLDFQEAILTADFRRDAARLDLPFTIIHGDRDASAPIELTGQVYAKLILGSKLLVYEGGAHGLMVTHADRLASDIAEEVRS